MNIITVSGRVLPGSIRTTGKWIEFRLRTDRPPKNGQPRALDMSVLCHNVPRTLAKDLIQEDARLLVYGRLDLRRIGMGDRHVWEKFIQTIRIGEEAENILDNRVQTLQWLAEAEGIELDLSVIEAAPAKQGDEGFMDVEYLEEETES